MQTIDVKDFSAAMNGLAEVVDHKPVSQKGLEMWFDTLKEFPTPQVLGLIRAWPKSHTKFPAPADIWKALNEYRTKRLEQTAAADKLAFAQGERHMGATEHGKRKLAEIYAILRRPKRTPVEHWESVLADATMTPFVHKFAREALDKIRPPRAPTPEREPGQDDEELAFRDVDPGPPPAPPVPRETPSATFADLPEDALEAEFRAEGINARPANPRRQKPLDSRNSR